MTITLVQLRAIEKKLGFLGYRPIPKMLRYVNDELNSISLEQDKDKPNIFLSECFIWVEPEERGFTIYNPSYEDVVEAINEHLDKSGKANRLFEEYYNNNMPS